MYERRCITCENIIESTFVYDEEVFKTSTTRKKCYSCSPYIPINGISPVRKRQTRVSARKVRRISQKRDLIRFAGNCCQRCGYNKNLAALEFHHLDPNMKDFEITGSNISTLSSKGILQEELDKCILLCSNCHREEHNPDCVLIN